jgi:hypothetical protein
MLYKEAAAQEVYVHRVTGCPESGGSLEFERQCDDGQQRDGESGGKKKTR